MDGTGLSTIPPEHLTPLLKRMPWDAVNVDNHELYFDATVQHLIDSGFVAHWNGTYLSFNTLLAATQGPLGHRYTFLHGNGSNTTLLTFGFLYNFLGHCASTRVQRVQEAVRQEWFRNVLQHPPQHYDAILVLAHMDCVDPLVSVILDAIRNLVVPTMPVLFVTGHSHRRAHQRLDDHAASFEAGRFLDALGWVSFSLPSSSVSQTIFDYRYMDANKQTLYETIGATTKAEFSTPRGHALTKEIHQTQHKLGLRKVLGCSSKTYSLEAGFESTLTNPSLWWLYLNKVIPKQLLHKVDNRKTTTDSVFVQGTGAFRYSLMSGKITRDDVIAVCPFNDSIYEFGYALQGFKLLEVLDRLEQTYSIESKYSMPVVATSPATIDANGTYQIYIPDFGCNRILPFIANVTKQTVRLTKRQTRRTPKRVCFHDTCLYTTNMWLDYVREEMPCLLEEASTRSDTVHKQPSLPASSLLGSGTDGINESIGSSAIAFAGYLLMSVLAIHLTANFVRKQRRWGAGEGVSLLEDPMEVTGANGCGSYGAIRSNRPATTTAFQP